MKIDKATLDDLNEVARLFDLYRQFYECEPDLELAREFIAARISNGESTIFIAVGPGNEVMGFTQLYPSFCSVEAVMILILYDLYVDANHRKSGVGEALMNRATEHARRCGAARIDLLTDKTNLAGQSLYEKLGYVRTNQDFFAYSLALDQSP